MTIWSLADISIHMSHMMQSKTIRKVIAAEFMMG